MEIPLDAAVEGDVLAADVKSGGTMLLPAGAKLAASLLETLHSRGVERITVERDGPPPAGPDRIETAIAELEHMFSEVRDDHLMDDIYQVAHSMLEKARG